MRYLFGILTAVVAVPALIYSQAPAPAQPRTPVSTAIFVDHDKVAGALAKGGSLVAASDVSVSGSHRDKPGQVEVHDKEMDVLYITDGTATFVTGGKIVGAKSSRPDQWLGTDITGGTTHKLVKGDVIVVPAGMPHWFKEVPGPLSYYVVKVIKP
jgi:mannose-6-phosphate isomerase-like protein (cupin superfamily)